MMGSEPEFASWQSYGRFRFEITRKSRYIRSEESERFLAAVADSCESRMVRVPEEKIFWRCQAAHDWDYEEDIDDLIPIPAPASRMVPPADRATEGRANPKGIPCLYMATTKELAMSETRPWKGALITLAQFKTRRALKLIDCSTSRVSANALYLREEPSPAKRADIAWANINGAFAEPVTRGDDTADYAATQAIADLFRAKGYDGLVYKSQFGAEGHNLAIFNISDAEPINCTLFKAKDVVYTFSEAGNTIFYSDRSTLRVREV
jgi:RES domain-containing protein